MAFGIIYKITNTVTGKAYIGQTTHSLRTRWRLHCSASSTCTLLHDAILEHGKEAFKIEQIDSGDSREELNQKEVAWILKENSKAPNGYNIDNGGYYIEYSEESRCRMSENHANVTGENNPMYGKQHNSETRKLISERLLGKYTGKNSCFHRPVINLDTGEKFDTATEAANAYRVTVSTLTKTCRGVQKRTANCRWAYLDEKGVV